jgi:hypothetical protein
VSLFVRAFPQQSLKQEFKIVDPVRNYKMANIEKKDRFLTGLTAVLRAVKLLPTQQRWVPIKTRRWRVDNRFFD